MIIMDKYFIEETRDGKFLLIEKDGDFYNHGLQDAIVASFNNKEKAYEVCDLLNIK